MTILPNMRLLGLPSQDSGRDWDSLTKRIDLMIEEVEGFDLAEETVVIEYVKNEVNVFRPVIGGLRELSSPWLLTDRTSGQVETVKLDLDHWEDVLEEIHALKEERNVDSLTLMLKRRLETTSSAQLRLSAEVFFSFF